MAEHIRIRKSDATWVVRAADAVIAESTAALELAEGDYPAVIYFPREDVAMAFLEPTATSSHCPHKGDASYFSISTPGETLTDAAWSYESPKDGVTELAGHIAFYDQRDGSLIAGDAMQTLGGVAVAGVIRWLFPLPGFATWHKPTAAKSAEKLLALNPTRLAIGHGRVLENPINAMKQAIAIAKK